MPMGSNKTTRGGGGKAGSITGSINKEAKRQRSTRIFSVLKYFEGRPPIFPASCSLIPLNLVLESTLKLPFLLLLSSIEEPQQSGISIRFDFLCSWMTREGKENCQYQLSSSCNGRSQMHCKFEGTSYSDQSKNQEINGQGERQKIEISSPSRATREREYIYRKKEQEMRNHYPRQVRSNPGGARRGRELFEEMGVRSVRGAFRDKEKARRRTTTACPKVKGCVSSNGETVCELSSLIEARIQGIFSLRFSRGADVEGSPHLVIFGSIPCLANKHVSVRYSRVLNKLLDFHFSCMAFKVEFGTNNLLSCSVEMLDNVAENAKPFVHPPSRNRSISRRKSGDRYDKAYNLHGTDGERSQVCYPKKFPAVEGGEIASSNDASENSHMNLIPLEGCSSSEIVQFLTDRWEATVCLLDDPSVEAPGELYASLLLSSMISL
ncbi:hypothetical protein Cni_G11124 [Canna indica]|uniref:Uncharacterized protein n=1 Tax=Canna indica TaxID=4628 RepID=A0AAQ3K7G8_9LILI|nr:hypothetical protein Cni_G11124 [Canna indica]